MTGLKRITIVVFALLLVAPDPALAQRRRTPRKATPSRTATNTAAETERREAAGRVADRIKSLSRFLYIYGGTVKTIADAEKGLGDTATPAEREAVERGKAAIGDSIANVRIGLEEVESDFGTKPSLRPYYGAMIGAGGAAAQAERLAAAGRFDEAGQYLLRALGNLADTLAAMQRQ